MACEDLLRGQIGELIQRDLRLEGMGPEVSNAREGAAARFHEELSALPPQVQSQFYKQLGDYKLCNGATRAESWTHIQGDGRKKTVAPR